MQKKHDEEKEKQLSQNTVRVVPKNRRWGREANRIARRERKKKTQMRISSSASAGRGFWSVFRSRFHVMNPYDIYYMTLSRIRE